MPDGEFSAARGSAGCVKQARGVTSQRKQELLTETGLGLNLCVFILLIALEKEVTKHT